MEFIRMPEHEALVKEMIGGEMELLELTDWELEKQLPEERAAQLLSNILRSPAESAVVSGNPSELTVVSGNPAAEAVVRQLPEPGSVRRKWAWRAAAAVFILASGLGGYRLLRGMGQERIADVQSLPQDVAPGTNKAVLTLANGTTIVLDSAHAGKISQQGGVSVVKLDSGRLAYTTGNEKPAEVLYNTLHTKRRPVPADSPGRLTGMA
jgi:hypothetical protein